MLASGHIDPRRQELIGKSDFTESILECVFINFGIQCFLKVIMFDGRCGVVVRILAYYARGRGFDSRTVQKFVCMNMSICIGSGCFYE
jgi:hypothetical protein